MYREHTRNRAYKKATYAAAMVMALCFLTSFVFGAYVPTSRDTKLPPQAVTYEIADTSEFTYLTKVGALEYYFREDRDVFMVVDTRNGYSWKTGLDVPFNTDVDKAFMAAKTPEEKEAVAVPKEERLNATYIGLANSLITVETYDEALNIQLASSASQKGAESQLMTVSDTHYRLDVNFTDLDLQVKVHVHLTEKGFVYNIYDEEIEGAGADILAAILITPFLGAAGGVQNVYNPETGQYGDKIKKPMTPGYILIPDGSGALVRFRENTVSLKKYEGNVFGVNYAETTYYYSDNSYSIAKKEPLMPVFGIAHGDNQAAFVAWAEEGAEHMQIIVSPNENMTYYNFAYPRFIYNQQIHQVYNRKGDGYFRLYPDRLHFDVTMEYRFLEGDGSDGTFPADYAGMALEYREYLLSTGELTERLVQSDETPIRIDFIMSDIKKGIVGTNNVVTTTADQVNDILTDLHESGLTNINSGLLGFQDGGINAGKPWDISFTGSIGSRRDFTRLFEDMNNLGIDVSFSQDYTQINSLQMNIAYNQAYHINKWGIRAWLSNESFVPVTEISYARPSKSAEWLISQTNKAKSLGALSATVTGMTGMLLSHYGQSPTSASEAIELYQKTFEGLGMTINAETPNQYLWKYVDRFLQMPVLTTQYIIATDTVPFLQLVLNGTMEMYAPYSNFSFYTQEDILRMIDYNVYPSFVITHEPAYLLSSTNSLMYYSTEYDLYKDIILSVQKQVSDVLSAVSGVHWIDRRVLADGFILNTYEDGTYILINYTDEQLTTNEGVSVMPKSAIVIAGDRS